MEKKSNAEKRNLTVETVFHGMGQEEKLPPSRAYLFDNKGNYINSEPLVKAKQSLSFNIEGSSNYSVVVGPDLLSDPKSPPQDLAEKLKKANASYYDIASLANSDKIRAAISKFTWFCWWETCIVVHGNVKKLINPGSPDPKYLSICNGVVQIFQVDLGCTLDSMTSFHVITLRNLLVDRLRGHFVEAERVVAFTGPIPPGPLRNSRVVSTGSSKLRLNEMKAAKNESPVLLSKSLNSMALVSKSINTVKFSSQSDLANTLVSARDLEIKQLIVANKSILWVHICELIPDWRFCWQKLGEVPIQSDGSFSAEICFWCPNDFPDLYFEVVQNINGVDTEIYDPQIACNTYYNYDGAQSVEIVVTDPRAVACVPTHGGPGYKYVEVLGITDIDLQNINGLNTPFTSGTGLVNWGGNYVPFGGTLAFNMKYHPDMFGSYYRWSYKFDGDADFTPVTAPVVHQYQELISIFPLTFQKIPVTLGPLTVGTNSNLYAFKDPAKDWVSVDNYNDLFDGFFDSTGGISDPVGYNPADHDGLSNRKSGMCTLLLEVFDSTGNFIGCNNPLGIRTEGDVEPGVPATRPFKFLLPSGSSYTEAPTGNITNHGRLLFRLYVNNNQTVAKLPAVKAGGLSASECGFLHIPNTSVNVEIDYVARHHENYMNWQLDVYRGLCGIAALTSGTGSAPPIPFPAVASFINAAETLLGVTPHAICGYCPQGAAFSVNLHCEAWATNGRGRMSNYDSNATVAFALLVP